MPKQRVKLLIWIVLCVVATLAILGAVAGLGRLVLYFNSGADPASALNLIPEVPADLDERLRWLPDHPDAAQHRPMEEPTRQQISDAYLRAWAQLGISYELGRPYGLKTYFTGQALDAVTATLTETAAAGWHASRSNLRHELQLTFYSDDGSIVSLTDHNLVVQHLRQPQARVDQVVESSGFYQALLLLEDGNWRIRLWKRLGDAEQDPVALAAEPAPGFVGVSGTRLILDGQPFDVAGVSYYPRDASWDAFWPNYSAGRTAEDLVLMRSLGLNTVRIFVPFFNVSDEERLAQMLADIKDFLFQADAAGMKVIVTLFDHRTDHHPVHWAADGRYLAALVPALADDPALLAWDLKNEPDLDYPLHGAALVDGWLAYVAHEVRRHDRHHLLTVGWSSPEAASNLAVAAVTDLISYHYLDPAEVYGARAQTLQRALPEKPLLLGEFGLSTWDSLFPGGHTEAEQLQHYAAILRAHRQLDSVGYLSWTLHDYSQVNLAQFRTPWRRGTQANMGVVRLDGTLKPAAALLVPNAELDLPALPLWHRFTKLFWRALAAVTAAGILILFLFRRRRRGEEARRRRGEEARK
jgi:hypothetical protein